MKKGIWTEKECFNCKKMFITPSYKDKRGVKFCCHECYSLSLKGKKRQPLKKETKIKISLANKGANNGMFGKHSWNLGTKGVSNSLGRKVAEETKEKLRQINRKGTFKKCIVCSKTFWASPGEIKKNKKFCSRKCYADSKEGETSLRVLIWRSKRYKNWRASVFERDNYVCQDPFCNHIEKTLNVHHIFTLKNIMKINNIKTKEDAEKCDKLYEINNGITLCKKCHKKTQGKEQKFEDMFKEIVKSKI